MINLRRVLEPEDRTPFSEIYSFTTESYIGVYVDYNNGFIIMTRNGDELEVDFIKNQETLQDLDECVYNLVEEHIDQVSTSRRVKIEILEEDDE